MSARSAVLAAQRFAAVRSRAAARRARSAKGAYRRNVALCALLVLLATAWFEIHLRLYATGTRLLSGTLTLFAAGKLVHSALGRAVEGTPVTERTLGKAWAAEALVFLLLLIVVLSLTTSSIYLEYQDPPAGTREVEVQITKDGRLFVEPWSVRSYDRIVGRPFFLQLSSVPLVLHMAAPRGYEPLARTLRPGRSLHVQVPADFTRKTFAILCLVPGNILFNQLPRTSDQPEVRYAVRLVHAGVAHRFEDVRRQVLCTGAGAEDLPNEVAKQKESFLLQLQTQLKLAMPDFPEESLRERVAMFEAELRYEATPEFKGREPVVIEVLRNGAPIATRTADPLAGKVQPIVF